MDTNKIIKRNRFCVLATCRNNKPEAATMAYFFEDGNFFFITLHNSRKYRNLQVNRKVAIVVGASIRQPSIQIDGVADFVSTELDRNYILGKIKRLNPKFARYYTQKNVVFFKIKPTALWNNGKRLR